jgi:transcriptional regulator PpsR
MTPFIAPENSLGALPAKTAAQLIAASSDVVLIVDDKGVIRDVATGIEEIAKEDCSAWLGRPWIDTVTYESRPKVQSLLSSATESGVPRWRHINLALAPNTDLPLMFSAIRIENKNHVVAIGRDLRQVAALQQRLVDAQQSMERDYWQLRQAETRYRHLFEMVPEAVLIVSAQTQKIVEANSRAASLFGRSPGEVVGRFVTDAFSEAGQRSAQALLAGVRATGQSEETHCEGAQVGETLVVAASLFRQEDAAMFLVRIGHASDTPPQRAVARKSASELLAETVKRMPDGFVVTDADGLILVANAAFLNLAQVATDEQLRGESLERWLGRSGVDLSVLIANLRQHGSVRLFSTNMRGEQGLSTEVEISAVSLQNHKPPCFGFAVRSTGRRLAPATTGSRSSARSVEQLAELVGQVPLKDLVQESTDLIEKLCIEAALELTQDNRASAAEMLGLSRQSLYVKLRRHGLGDLPTEGDKH